jgi:ABC-type multidrug transport system fused ATPase/permease subunit
MGDFWSLARGMFRYRARVIAAVVCSMLGAGGLGVGLLGAGPVLQAILEPKAAKTTNLQTIVTGWNQSLGGVIPEGVIQALPTGPMTAVVAIVIALGLLTVISSVFNFLHAYLSMTVVTRTIADLRERVFAHVLHLPLHAFMRTGPSNQLTRVITDCGEMGGGLTNLLNKTVEQVFKASAAIIAAFVVNWKLAGIAVVAAPIIYIVVSRTGRAIRRGARKGLAARGELLRTAGEAIENIRVVKSFTAEDRESARFHESNRHYLAHDMRVRTAKAISSPVVEVITLFALGTLTLIAAKAILDGHLSAKEFITVLASLGIAGGCLKPLTGLMNELQAAGAAAERIKELLNQPAEEGYADSRPVLPRHAQSIEFQGITYTYPNAETPALRDVSLRVRHGETVAVVGPNGSGKTTLLSLLPRLIEPDPGHGRVLVDGTDVSGVSLRSLRGQIGVVTQETMLFKGSLRRNIAYGADEPSEERIREAAAKARAEEFILARPGGFDAEIGERGSGLSGGQRQRIAIARAILRDPAILILDEATSMIDADSEAKIAAALAEFARGRTCLIIAHRLSTVMHADRIVVMDHGRIVDIGGHSELLARCNVYRLIAEHQLVKAGAGGAEAVGAK